MAAHSEKDGAAATDTSAFGFHPIAVWCDKIGESLATMLRPGNAGANHAGDHLEVLGAAFAQVPAGHRRHILVRSDSAGASHEVLAWLRARNTSRRRVEYSVGWRIDGDERAAITGLPASAWSPAIDADGGVREGAFVALRGRIAPSPLWTFPMRSPLDYVATVKAAAYPRPAPRSSYTTVGQPGSSGVRGAGQATGAGKEEVDVVGRSCFEVFTDGMGSAWAYATAAPGRVASV